MLKVILVSAAASAAAAALRTVVRHIERRSQRSEERARETGIGREAEARDPDWDFPGPDNDGRWR